MEYIDEYGTWEITKGNGCISKCIVEPTDLYLAENPTPTAEEIVLAEKQAKITSLIDGGEFTLPDELRRQSLAAAETNDAVMGLFEYLATALPKKGSNNNVYATYGSNPRTCHIVCNSNISSRYTPLKCA